MIFLVGKWVLNQTCLFPWIHTHTHTHIRTDSSKLMLYLNVLAPLCVKTTWFFFAEEDRPRFGRKLMTKIWLMLCYVWVLIIMIMIIIVCSLVTLSHNITHANTWTNLLHIESVLSSWFVILFTILHSTDLRKLSWEISSFTILGFVIYKFQNVIAVY